MQTVMRTVVVPEARDILRALRAWLAMYPDREYVAADVVRDGRVIASVAVWRDGRVAWGGPAAEELAAAGR